MRAPGLAATPSCLCRRLGPNRVPLLILSRLALGKIAELERPRRNPSALHPTCCLGTPSSVPCPRSDACRANKLPSLLAVQQRAIREEPCPGISAKVLL